MRILCVYMEPEFAKDRVVHRKIFTILRKHADTRFVLRERMRDVSRYDLVVSLGGDGTFIKASRHIGALPLLGINRNPSCKEGFYTRATIKDLDKKLQWFKEGKHTIIPLIRLRAQLGKKVLPLAINECFIGAEKSYHSAKYAVEVGGKKELQKSSGFLVATPSGTHAWYASMGGKPLAFSENKMAYMTREPYCGKTITCGMKGGLCSLRAKIKITYLLKYSGVVAIDSHECFPLRKNQTVTVQASPQRLHWVTFQKKGAMV